MGEAEKIITNAISKLKADGREPDKVVTNRMLAALQAHANTRRCDQAQKITKKFTDFMQAKGFSVVLTDPIERPPVPAYKQIDVEKTISDNQGKAGFDYELEEKVRGYIETENSSKTSKKHVEAITKALKVYNNLAEACRAT